MRALLFVLLFLVTSSCNNQKSSNNTSHEAAAYPIVVQDLLHEIGRYPDSTELRVQLVDTMDSLFLINEALAQIDSLIVRDSSNYGIWYRKGELAISIADTSLALSSFSRAATLYATPDVLLTLANLYAAQKNIKALSLCTKVIAQKPDRTYLAHSYYITGLYYENTGNTKVAIENFNTCIQQNYTYIDAYFEIGWVYFDQKKYMAANELFETATAVKPTDARGHYWNAKCLEKLGRLEQALNKYQMALNIDDTLKEAAEAIFRIKASKK